MPRRDHNNTKERIDWVVGTANVVDGFRVTYDPENDSFVLHEVDPNSLRLERSYERDSGKDKIVTSIKSNRFEVSVNHFQMLKQNYDYLIAVDTNTKIVNGIRLSICYSYVITKKLSDHEDDVPFLPLCGYAMINVKPNINPETLGWHLILKYHVNSSRARRFRVGLVVDSELGKIPKINSREIPYFSTYRLPAHVTLIYASDAMSDTLPNQMLRYCNNTAVQASNHLEENMEPLRRLTNGQGFCDGYIQVQSKSE